MKLQFFCLFHESIPETFYRAAIYSNVIKQRLSHYSFFLSIILHTPANDRHLFTMRYMKSAVKNYTDIFRQLQLSYVCFLHFCYLKNQFILNATAQIVILSFAMIAGNSVTWFL